MAGDCRNSEIRMEFAVFIFSFIEVVGGEEAKHVKLVG